MQRMEVICWHVKIFYCRNKPPRERPIHIYYVENTSKFVSIKTYYNTSYIPRELSSYAISLRTCEKSFINIA